MYVYDMNRWKARIHPATKQRMCEEVIAAAAELSKVDPDFIG
jgi:hypothetical protein